MHQQPHRRTSRGVAVAQGWRTFQSGRPCPDASAARGCQCRCASRPPPPEECTFTRAEGARKPAHREGLLRTGQCQTAGGAPGGPGSQARPSFRGAGPAADHVLLVQSAVSRVPKCGHMVPRGPHGPLCEPSGQSLPPRWLYPWKAGRLLQQRKHPAQTPALPFRIKTGSCLHAGKCLLATCTGSARRT